MRRLVDSARVARLATVDADGRPHVVPVCFVRVGDTVFSAVDSKPKQSTRLRRLSNLEENPDCCLLVDRYDDDWSRLWWVRLDGRGRIVHDERQAADAVAALTGRYPQYESDPPTGPVLAVEVHRWSGWSA